MTDGSLGQEEGQDAPPRLESSQAAARGTAATRRGPPVRRTPQ